MKEGREEKEKKNKGNIHVQGTINPFVIQFNQTLTSAMHHSLLPTTPTFEHHSILSIFVPHHSNVIRI